MATLTFGVPIKCRRYGLKRNNNCIGRDHEYSRKLEKLCRGHKDLEGISAVFDVADVYYNYIDKQRLKKKSRTGRKWVFKERMWRTPAERAKIKLDLGKRFQLLNLIKKSYAED